MFGWEFPPFNSGGLGTACYGLTKALAANGIEVTFVVPSAPNDFSVSYMKMIVAEKYPGAKRIKVVGIPSLLSAYKSSEEYGNDYNKLSENDKKNYGRNIYEEVERYAENAKAIASNEKFDIIHAHDWMSFKAGINARAVSGKPLVAHIHATEFDRTAGHCNQYIYDIEREGMHRADRVIAVSNFTKEKAVLNYGVSPEKVNVVHNAVEFYQNSYPEQLFRLKRHYKIVLFLGRVTIQKGPDWFLYAAKRVLDFNGKVKFIIAGSGDMETRIIEKAAELGIADSVLFAGFVPDNMLDAMYQMADLYVMPSVSEPFGITPLEAIRNGTPVIISRQSGVSEILNNCVKVDFWDTHMMADKIIGLLKDKKAYNRLKKEGIEEVKKITWLDSAKKCIDVYVNVYNRGGAYG